jgi:hypothetical protein
MTGGRTETREVPMLTNVLLYGALIVVGVLYFMRRSQNRKTKQR